MRKQGLTKKEVIKTLREAGIRKSGLSVLLKGKKLADLLDSKIKIVEPTSYPVPVSWWLPFVFGKEYAGLLSSRGLGDFKSATRKGRKAEKMINGLGMTVFARHVWTGAGWAYVRMVFGIPSKVVMDAYGIVPSYYTDLLTSSRLMSAGLEDDVSKSGFLFPQMLDSYALPTCIFPDVPGRMPPVSIDIPIVKSFPAVGIITRLCELKNYDWEMSKKSERYRIDISCNGNFLCSCCSFSERDTILGTVNMLLDILGVESASENPKKDK